MQAVLFFCVMIVTAMVAFGCASDASQGRVLTADKNEVEVPNKFLECHLYQHGMVGAGYEEDANGVKLVLRNQKHLLASFYIHTRCYNEDSNKWRGDEHLLIQEHFFVADPKAESMVSIGIVEDQRDAKLHWRRRTDLGCSEFADAGLFEGCEISDPEALGKLIGHDGPEAIDLRYKPTDEHIKLCQDGTTEALKKCFD